MKKSALILSLCLLLFLPTAWGQSSSLQQLKNDRQEALKEIERNNKLLSTTQNSTKSLLAKLRSLDAQLESRRKAIDLINKEITGITKQQQQLEAEVQQLKRELENKKQQYAHALQGMSRHRSGYDKLMFLFSAESLGQTYRRLRYLNEYTAWRKQQAKEIIEKQELIDKRLKELAQSKIDKEALLATRTQERNRLQQQEREQQKTVKSLRSKESTLKKEIAARRKEAAQLDKRIEEVIAEEARRAAAQSKKTGSAMTSAEIKLSGSFESNKGKLPVPVTSSYLLVGKFGKHRHQSLKGVEVNSSGIDLQAAPNAEARSVFQGEVTRIFVMPGYNSSVIVRHGNYLTIYANLSQVYVKVGDKVKTGQSIGRIFTDKEEGNNTVLHFQLWKETTKLNPELWLNLK